MQKVVFNPLTAVTPAYQNKAKAKLDRMKPRETVVNVDVAALPIRKGAPLSSIEPATPLQRLGELQPRALASFDVVSHHSAYAVPLQSHRYARHTK